MSAKTTTSLPVQHLFTIHLDIDPHHIIANGPEGTKLVAPIRGGTVSGGRVSGTVIEHSGGDWVSIGPKGEMRIDVRFSIRTDDDTLIYVSYRGVLNGGDAKAAPLFETGAEQYAWLNALQGIGLGTAAAGGVDYEFYALA